MICMKTWQHEKTPARVRTLGQGALLPLPVGLAERFSGRWIWVRD
ncbi:MAG: hypothetical protein WCG94_05720 [Methanothrix sp.]